MRKEILAFAAVSASFLGASSASAASFFDLGQITVSLTQDLEFKYKIIGQVAFVTSTTTGGTSGGQLEGADSSTSAVDFVEVFPQATLDDYLTFSFFGRVHRLDVDTDEVLDTSVIFAVQRSVIFDENNDPLVVKVEDLNSFGYDETTLVNALGTFDSPEFLNVLGEIGGNADTKGRIAKPQLSDFGETLELVTFMTGPNGDEALAIGTLQFSYSRIIVPEPSGLALVGVAAPLLMGRRRKA